MFTNLAIERGPHIVGMPFWSQGRVAARWNQPHGQSLKDAHRMSWHSVRALFSCSGPRGSARALRHGEIVGIFHPSHLQFILGNLFTIGECDLAILVLWCFVVFHGRTPQVPQAISWSPGFNPDDSHSSNMWHPQIPMGSSSVSDEDCYVGLLLESHFQRSLHGLQVQRQVEKEGAGSAVPLPDSNLHI